MHDPMTVAFDIKRPWPDKRDQEFMGSRWSWPTLITIWHHDPEIDHTDDSCGWFMRSRHGDPAVLATIIKEFQFHAIWAGGWFSPETGMPVRSNHAILLDMFYVAARAHFKGWGDQHGWRRAHRFMQRHLFDILQCAESPSDGMKETFEQHYGPSPLAERIEGYAHIVYGCLLRWERPWYRHPRWHLWHWSIQIHPLQQIKRWLFSRCCKCGKRFPYGYAPVSGSWSGGGPRWFRGEPNVYHANCNDMHDNGWSSANTR